MRESMHSASLGLPEGRCQRAGTGTVPALTFA